MRGERGDIDRQMVDRARDGDTSAIFFACILLSLAYFTFSWCVFWCGFGVLCWGESFCVCLGGCCFVFHDRVLARPQP